MKKDEYRVYEIISNSDYVVLFGADYAHFYDSDNLDRIKDDISAFKDDCDTSSWDNNEIEHISNYNFDDTFEFENITNQF